MVSASFGQGTEDDGEEGRGRPNVAGELTSAHSGLPTTPGAPVQGVAIAEGVVVGVPIDEAIERARRRLSGPIAADLAMDQPGVGDALVPASLGGDTDSAMTKVICTLGPNSRDVKSIEMQAPGVPRTHSGRASGVRAPHAADSTSNQ